MIMVEIDAIVSRSCGYSSFEVARTQERRMYLVRAASAKADIKLSAHQYPLFSDQSTIL